MCWTKTLGPNGLGLNWLDDLQEQYTLLCTHLFYVFIICVWLLTFCSTMICHLGNWMLKTVNFQRLVFTVAVSQHVHKISNLWKFELNRSSNLRDNNKGNIIVTQTCVRLDGWVLNLRSRNQISGKLLLSRKLWHFRGSRFAQCLIPSTSPHYSSPRKVFC